MFDDPGSSMYPSSSDLVHLNFFGEETSATESGTVGI